MALQGISPIKDGQVVQVSSMNGGIWFPSVLWLLWLPWALGILSLLGLIGLIGLSGLSILE